MPLPELTSDINSLGKNPHIIAATSTVRFFEIYFDTLVKEHGIEGAVIALINVCPEEEQRKALWMKYVDLRDADNGNTFDAAIKTIGDWVEYQSDAMGLNDITTEYESVSEMSPKALLVVMTFRLFEKFLACVIEHEHSRGAAAVLLAWCPDKNKREQLWHDYSNARDDEGELAAAVFQIGNWWTYMSHQMNLQERSIGGC